MAERAGKRIRLDERVALRPEEAAAALGVSERKFRAMLPHIPHVRDEGVLLIPVRELVEWLGQRAREQVATRSRADRVLDEIMGSVRASRASNKE